MPQFKCIATLCWKFDSDEDYQQSLERAKQQLEQILDSSPQGGEFDGFSIQIDLARMKDRKRLIHLGEFNLDEVFPYVTEHESKRDFIVGETTHTVKMNSDRYFVFKSNPQCVSCGLAGSKMILDLNPGDQSPHFNLYAIEDGRYVLMTKDHILAKACGGSDELNNFQTCCAICNNLKGHYNLTYPQVRELRTLYNNDLLLPRKELRELINKRRDEMVKINENKGGAE